MGTKYWGIHEYQSPNSTRYFTTDKNAITGNETAFKLGIESLSSGKEYGFSQTVNTIIGKEYHLSAWMCGSNVKANIIIRGVSSSSGGWLMNQNYNEIKSGGENIDNWHFVDMRFVAQREYTAIEFDIVQTTASNGYLYVKKIMLNHTKWFYFTLFVILSIITCFLQPHDDDWQDLYYFDCQL